VNLNVAKAKREMGKVEKTRINPSDKSGKREREREPGEKKIIAQHICVKKASILTVSQNARVDERKRVRQGRNVVTVLNQPLHRLKSTSITLRYFLPSSLSFSLFPFLFIYLFLSSFPMSEITSRICRTRRNTTSTFAALQPFHLTCIRN